jgi:hypothetical protein
MLSLNLPYAMCPLPLLSPPPQGGVTVGFQLGGGEDPEASQYTRIRSLVLEELKAYFRPELLNRMDEVVVFRQLGRQQVRAGSQNGRRMAVRVASQGLLRQAAGRACETSGTAPAHCPAALQDTLHASLSTHQPTHSLTHPTTHQPSPSPLQVRRIADLELAKTAARMADRGIGLEVSNSLMERITAEGYNESMGARELRRAVTRLVDDALSDALLRGEVRAGEVAVLDCDAEGRTLVFNRSHANNIVAADIVYSSVAASVAA